MVAMQPFHAPFDTFHEYTKPKDWLEGLLKAYVGDGFAADFYREVAAFVDEETRTLVYRGAVRTRATPTSWWPR